MIILKWKFVGDTGEESAHLLIRSPKWQRTLGQHNSFTWKMVLKWTFVHDTRDDSAHSFIRERELKPMYWFFTDYLKKTVHLLHWGRNYAHLLFRSRTQSFKSVSELYLKVFLKIGLCSGHLLLQFPRRQGFELVW